MAKVTDLDPDKATAALDRYRTAKKALEQWEAEEEEARGALLAMLDSDTEEAHLNGVKVLTYKVIHVDRLDTKKLREQYPDVYQAFLRDTSHYRLNLT